MNESQQIPIATVNLPKEIVRLPSGGIVYPMDSPLHTTELEIYHLTARGEDVLTSRSLLKRGVVVDRLIQGAIVNRLVNVDDMILGDKNAVMVAYRITGYGSSYSVMTECPECEEKSEQIFDLSKMPIVGLGTDPISEGSNRFAFELPITKKKVHFRLLTGRDDKEVTAIIESGKRAKDEVEKNVTARLFTNIVSVEGDEDRGKIRNFVDLMPAGDSLALRNYIADIEPGIDMIGTMVCPKCGATNDVDCPMGIDFFWPGWRRTKRRSR